VVNMLGIGAALIADTATVIDAEGSRSMISTVAMFVIPAIVLANVGAIIAVGQADPDRVLAERQANHERELAMTRAAHDQALVNQRHKLELELEQLSNTKRLDTLKDDYIRSLGGAQPARLTSAGPEMVTMGADGVAVESAKKSGKGSADIEGA
jgi:hypothetical protein